MEKLRKYKNYPVELRFVKLMGSHYYVEYRIIKDPENNQEEAERRKSLCWIKWWWLKNKKTYTSWSRIRQYAKVADINPNYAYMDMIISYDRISVVKHRFKMVYNIIEYLKFREEGKQSDLEEYYEKFSDYPHIIQ